LLWFGGGIYYLIYSIILVIHFLAAYFRGFTVSF
jgi:hypothetical protein